MLKHIFASVLLLACAVTFAPTAETPPQQSEAEANSGWENALATRT